MVEAFEFSHADEYLVVRPPGLTRLAEAAVRTRGTVIAARQKRQTITEVTQTLAVAGKFAQVTSTDPDGARWSVTVIPVAPLFARSGDARQ